MALQRITHFDHSGGLNTKVADTALKPNESPSLKNVHLGSTGAVQRRTGASEYSSAIVASTPTKGMWRLVTSTGGDDKIALSGGGFYFEGLPGVWGSALFSGWDANAVTRGLAYRDHLWFSNGVDSPLLWSKDTGFERYLEHESILNPPTDWTTGCYPTGFAVTYPYRNEKLCAWGCKQYPSRLYFSDDEDPFQFDFVSGTATYFDALRDNSEPVTLVAPLYDFTLVFKETQCAVYSWGVHGYQLVQTLGAGCPAPLSGVQVGKDYYFWSDSGPARLSGIQEYGDINPVKAISLPIESELRSVRHGSSGNIQVMHDIDKNVIVWFYPKGSSSVNNAALAYHYDTGAWVPWDGLNASYVLSYQGDSSSLQHFLCQDDGSILKLDGTYTDAGTTYTSEFVTAWEYAGDMATRFRVPTLWFSCNQSYDVDVSIQWDSGTWLSLGNLEDLSGETTSRWDTATFVWDVDYWDLTMTELVKVLPTGTGRRFRLKFSSDSSDSFDLTGWEALASQRGQR